VFDTIIEVPVTIPQILQPLGTHIHGNVDNDSGLLWSLSSLTGRHSKDALIRHHPAEVWIASGPALPRSSIIISDDPAEAREPTTAPRSSRS